MPAERKGQSNTPQSRKNYLKLLEARREQLRSSSMPTVDSLPQVKEAEKSRPHSAENKTNSEKVDFKTLLHCMLAGEWMSAFGRISNLEENSFELSQANVNISLLHCRLNKCFGFQVQRVFVKFY